MKLAPLVTISFVGLSTACDDAPTALAPAYGSSGACLTVRSDDADLLDCAAVDDYHYAYDDDACKKKRYPSERTRRIACPVLSSSAGSFAKTGRAIAIDTTALAALPPELAVTVILVRHVDGVPHYLTLRNATSDETFQPWSSTKFIGALGAAAHLREASNGAVGLTAKTAEGTSLGDLFTVVTSYEEARFTSNGAARYFLNLSGRDRALSLVQSWLGRPGESYGGNYGAAAPELGSTFTEASGAKVTLALDDRSGIPNRMSTGSLAEAMKRVAVGDDPATRLPGVTDSDLQTMLYGAETSALFPGEWGGLSRDPALYLQEAVDIEAVEAASRGRHRLYGKLGWGPGPPGEFVNVAYGCFPELDDTGKPIVDRGAELVVATRYASGPTDGPARDRELARLWRRIVRASLPLAQPTGSSSVPLPPASEETPGRSRAADGGGAPCR